MDDKQNFSQWMRETAAGPVNGLAEFLVKIGIGPNALTIAGVVVSSASGVLAAQGMFAWAALAFIMGTPFDAMDGAVARASGKVSKFGALLDSTLDRYGEAALLGGICYYFAAAAEPVNAVLAFFALFGSVMVSYVRARSEGLGLENKVGLATRLERIMLLVLGMLLRQPLVTVAVLVVLTQITVVQRVMQGYKAAQAEED